MTSISLQQLNIAELEELLMEETKKFTAAFHDGTPQEQKDIMRKMIDEIQLLLEKRKQGITDPVTVPAKNPDENITPERNETTPP